MEVWQADTHVLTRVVLAGCRGWRHHTLAEAWQGSTVASGSAVLHDLAICTAEAVAQAYLGEV
jgi:hypothetical protein